MKKALNKSRKGREVLHDFQLCILGFLRLRCIGLSVPVHGDHVGSTDEESVEKLRLQYGRISGGNGVFISIARQTRSPSVFLCIDHGDPRHRSDAASMAEWSLKFCRPISATAPLRRGCFLFLFICRPCPSKDSRLHRSYGWTSGINSDRDPGSLFLKAQTPLPGS